MKASSTYGGHGYGYAPGNAVDGSPNKMWAPNDGPDSWLLIDLADRHYFGSLFWQHLPVRNRATHYGMMKALRVRVGDKDENDLNGNEVCAENLDLSEKRNNRVYCTDGPIWGRYVVLQKGPTPKSERFFVAEIKVYEVV